MLQMEWEDSRMHLSALESTHSADNWLSQFCSSPAKPAKLEFTPECAQSSYMHKAWQNSYTDKKLLLHLYTTCYIYKSLQFDCIS